MDWKSLGKGLGWGALFTAGSFGINCALAAISKQPILPNGVIAAVTMAANFAFKYITATVGKRFCWSSSTVQLITLGIGTSIIAATMVASVAFGLLNPLGLTCCCLFNALMLSIALTNTTLSKLKEV